jgi:hypothetical protein
MTQQIEIEIPNSNPESDRIEELENAILLLQGELEGITSEIELYHSIFRAIRDQLNLALGDD